MKTRRTSPSGQTGPRDITRAEHPIRIGLMHQNGVALSSPKQSEMDDLLNVWTPRTVRVDDT